MRFWKRSDAEARTLARASRIRHWRQLDRRRRRRLWLSRAWVAVRDRRAQLRQDSRVLAGLVGGVLGAILGTAARVAALEALATAARHVVRWGTLSRRSTREATEDSSVLPSARRRPFLPCSSRPSG